MRRALRPRPWSPCRREPRSSRGSTRKPIALEDTNRPTARLGAAPAQPAVRVVQAALAMGSPLAFPRARKVAALAQATARRAVVGAAGSAPSRRRSPREEATQANRLEAGERSRSSAQPLPLILTHAKAPGPNFKASCGSMYVSRRPCGMLPSLSAPARGGPT